MELRVETAAWDDLSAVILPSKTALRATERAGKPLTDPRDTTEPIQSSVASGLLNIVGAWVHRPKLLVCELIPDFRPRGIVGPMARHFVGDVDGEPALR